MTDEEARKLNPESYPSLTSVPWRKANGSHNLQIRTISQADFDKLPAYNCSLPTGVFVSKCWKRDLNWRKKDAEPDWILGRYEYDPKDLGLPKIKITHLLIVWYDLEVV